VPQRCPEACPRQQSEEHHGRWKTKRAAVNTRNEQSTLELFIGKHGEENDDSYPRSSRERGERSRADGQKCSDIGEDVGNAGKYGKRNRIRDATGGQEDKYEERHEAGRDELSADIAAHDNLEIEEHARGTTAKRAPRNLSRSIMV